MEFQLSKTFMFFLQVILNLLVFIVAAWGIANIIQLIRKKRTGFIWIFFDRQILAFVLCFSFLGFAIGLMIGLSQSPVVQAAIPALLTFYGAFVTYLFAKDAFRDETTKYATVYSIIAVSFFLMYGIEVGSSEKNQAVKSRREFDLYYFEREEAIKQKYK